MKEVIYMQVFLYMEVSSHQAVRNTNKLAQERSLLHASIAKSALVAHHIASSIPHKLQGTRTSSHTAAINYRNGSNL